MRISCEVILAVAEHDPGEQGSKLVDARLREHAGWVAEHDPGEQGSKPFWCFGHDLTAPGPPSMIQENKDRNAAYRSSRVAASIVPPSMIQENKDRNTSGTASDDSAVAEHDPGEQGSKPGWSQDPP